MRKWIYYADGAQEVGGGLGAVGGGALKYGWNKQAALTLYENFDV
jgi:hypothetical protein